MHWVERLAADMKLSSDTSFALQLCLEEAVTNIVSHAFEKETTHDVRVALWRDETTLHAEVTDDGRPFNPLAHEPQETAVDLGSAQIGGLGIKLMRGFAQQLAYQRSGSINQLT